MQSISLFNLFIFYLTLFTHLLSCQDYRVLDFGAKGDGKSDDTLAVRAALAAATSSNGGRVIFDSGYSFVTGALNMTNNVILDIRGTILASLNASDYPIVLVGPWMYYGLVKQPLIASYNATNITITGGGTIDGQGPYWYACRNNATAPPCYPYGNPMLLEPKYSSNIRIEHLTFKDSPHWTIHLAYTSNVYINNITVTSPVAQLISDHLGLNTDGVDIDCSVNVTVENSYISTADDAISIKSGIYEDGLLYGRPTENVLVRNLTIGFSNGIAFGYETLNDIRNITFQDISLNGSLHGIHIKSQLGEGGIIQDVTYSNIQVINTWVAIEFNMYVDSNSNYTALPKMKNLIIDNVYGENVSYVYNMMGMPNSPIQNAYFSNINFKNITTSVSRKCQHIIGMCDNTTCPPCLQTETCFDASSDCTTYLGYCNLQAYRKHKTTLIYKT